MDTAETLDGSHPAPDRSTPGASKRYRADFVGVANDYFEIALVNWLFILLSLGLGTARARVRTFRFFYSSTRLDGHEFRFTGEGWALFKGMFLAVALLFAMAFVFRAVIATDSAGQGLIVAIAVAYALFLAYLGHYAYFRSRRYRFAHTVYREIRFHLDGSPTEFATGALVRFIGMIVTLGLLYPLYQNYVYRSIYSNLRYGHLRFRYTGDDDDFMRAVVPGFIVVLLTLGIYFFWWYPLVYGYFVDHLHVEGSRFRTTRISAADLFKLHVTNFCITVFTIGMGTPFVAARTAKFFVDRISLEGALDLEDAVETARTQTSALGEGLAETMDLDVDLGF